MKLEELMLEVAAGDNTDMGSVLSRLIAHDFIPKAVADGYRMVIALTDKGAVELGLSTPRIDIHSGNNRGFVIDPYKNNIWADIRVDGIPGVRHIDRSQVKEIFISGGDLSDGVFFNLKEIVARVVYGAIHGIVTDVSVPEEHREVPPTPIVEGSNVVTVDFGKRN